MYPGLGKEHLAFLCTFGGIALGLKKENVERLMSCRMGNDLLLFSTLIVLITACTTIQNSRGY